MMIIILRIPFKGSVYRQLIGLTYRMLSCDRIESDELIVWIELEEVDLRD